MTKDTEFKTASEFLKDDVALWLKRGLKISEQAPALDETWRESAGEAANYSRLVQIDTTDGNPVAVVFASTASWASLIRVNATTLCENLNRVLGAGKSDYEHIAALRVRVAPVEPTYPERMPEIR